MPLQEEVIFNSDGNVELSTTARSTTQYTNPMDQQKKTKDDKKTTIYKDKNGRRYSYNSETRRTSWLDIDANDRSSSLDFWRSHNELSELQNYRNLVPGTFVNNIWRDDVKESSEEKQQCNQINKWKIVNYLPNYKRVQSSLFVYHITVV